MKIYLKEAMLQHQCVVESSKLAAQADNVPRLLRKSLSLVGGHSKRRNIRHATLSAATPNVETWGQVMFCSACIFPAVSGFLIFRPSLGFLRKYVV